MSRHWLKRLEDKYKERADEKLSGELELDALKQLNDELYVRYNMPHRLPIIGNVPAICPHNKVDIGFTHSHFVCSKCNIDLPEES